MDAAGEELADRVRALLTLAGDVEEKRMFGTRAFLIDGRIVVGARAGGVLLVRVEEDTGAALALRPGVETAVMGTRTMGTGWLDVAPSVLAHDEELHSGSMSHGSTPTAIPDARDQEQRRIRGSGSAA